MAQDSSVLIIGPAQFSIAPETVALPTLAGIGGAALAAFVSGAGFDLPGYTVDGLETDHNTTDKEIRADEETDAIDVVIDKESNGLNVKLMQSTMQNLYYAMAGATMPDAATITFGGKVRPSIFRIGVIGPSTKAGLTRVLLLYRCYAKTALKIKNQRTSEAIYQCNFVALSDSTQPVNARTGTYKDF
jgi:hypothetical protein